MKKTIKNQTTFFIAAFIFVGIGTLTSLSPKEAHAYRICKEWKAGVSVTIPLDFSKIKDEGTITISGEMYDAIDASVHTKTNIDKSVQTHHHNTYDGSINTEIHTNDINTTVNGNDGRLVIGD